jgi:predicted AAA+ superfamily ATPase
LDDPALRDLALRDPRLFLSSYPEPMIIDEIQYAPELLHYVKMTVDQERQKYGRFLLTGSQAFPLMAGVTETLAGRIAVFHLYPLSFCELNRNSPISRPDEAALCPQ